MPSRGECHAEAESGAVKAEQWRLILTIAQEVESSIPFQQAESGDDKNDAAAADNALHICVAHELSEFTDFYFVPMSGSTLFTLK